MKNENNGDGGKLKKFVSGLVIGIAITSATSAYAEQIKDYVLTKIEYPIFVNGSELKSDELPALNYQGNTYLPLKAVGNALGTKVNWNQQLGRVEIGDSPDVKPKIGVYTPYNQYVQVININGKNYIFNYAPFVIKDSSGKYFFRFDTEVVNLLVSIGFKDYITGPSENPYIDGYVETRNRNFVEDKTNYTSITETYRSYRYFNTDKTKEYLISLKPNEEKGVIKIDDFSLERYLPLNDFFEQLGMKVSFVLDDSKKMMIWSFK
ncbi:stalk domain-containing protein [Paenibacillus sp. N3.4]|uniref:stalk domain-containing protein n=1 Tax=Paenibacillus sp. N3.4 TaxID=2603222 RepID=UPI001650AF0E|nr:stalk domain-containing protein [Paenibacillus sp. N3.4]